MTKDKKEQLLFAIGTVIILWIGYYLANLLLQLQGICPN